MKKKEKINRKHEVIPEKVYHAIRELADKIGGREMNGRFNNYLRIVARIYFKCLTEMGSFHSPYPLAKEYWIKVVGGRYSTYMSELDNAGIIEVSRNKGRNYFNLDINLCLSSLRVISAPYLPSKSSGKINLNTIPHFDLEERLGKRFLKCLGKVTFEEEIYQEVLRNGLMEAKPEDYGIDLTSFPLTLKLEAEVHYPHSIDRRWHKVETFLKKMSENNLSSFYYDGKVILDNPITFINRRKSSMLGFTRLLIEKIKCQSFDLSRDEEKTRRVFNVLTSFPNKAMPFIKLDGDPIVGIDAKTSQFQLLANLFLHFSKTGDQIANKFNGKRKTFILNLYGCYQEILKKNSDQNSPNQSIKRFYDDVIVKDFYVQLQHLLGLNNRSQAKMFCFTILFSKETTTSVFKDKIQEHYPLVIGTLELFKEKYGYNKLSINLQAMEAEIFIDHIFQRLYVKEKIICYTKHDSVIVRERDADKALEIVGNVYRELDFYVVLKIEDYSSILSDYRDNLNDEQEEHMDDDSPSDELISLIIKFQNEGIECLDYSDFELTITEGKDYLSENDYKVILNIISEHPHNRLPISDDIHSKLDNTITQLYNKYINYL